MNVKKINKLMSIHNVTVKKINNKCYTYRNNDLKHIYDTFEDVKGYLSILELIKNMRIEI